MNETDSNERLSRISTLWTVVNQAHRGTLSVAGQAQRQLLERYCGAVFRYLLGAVRNEHEAMDLFQEFAVKFLRGDFHRADPSKGRFRDYVKVALIHLVSDFRRRQRAQPGRLPEQFADPRESWPNDEEHGDDEGFLASWKEELILRAWDALLENNESYHAALLYHVQMPDAPSSEIAEHLTRLTNRKITRWKRSGRAPSSAGTIWKTLA